MTTPNARLSVSRGLHSPWQSFGPKSWKAENVNIAEFTAVSPEFMHKPIYARIALAKRHPGGGRFAPVLVGASRPCPNRVAMFISILKATYI